MITKAIGVEEVFVCFPTLTGCWQRDILALDQFIHSDQTSHDMSFIPLLFFMFWIGYSTVQQSSNLCYVDPLCHHRVSESNQGCCKQGSSRRRSSKEWSSMASVVIQIGWVAFRCVLRPGETYILPWNHCLSLSPLSVMCLSVLCNHNSAHLSI